MSKIVHDKICSGKIISIEKSKIKISIHTDCESQEKSCSAGCGGCGKAGREKNAMIITDDAPLYRVGQKIKVRQYYVSEVFAAFLLFGVPVLSALTLVLIWYICSPVTVESRIALLSCVAAFLIGFIPVQFVEKFVCKHYITALLTPPPTSSEMVVNG